MKKGVFLYLFSLISVLPAFAQMRTLTGTVTADSSGAPLPGVTIHLKGSTYRVATNPDGTYSMNVDGTPELLFSMVGYSSRELKVGPAMTRLDVKLQSLSSKLSEVVVVGYGEQSQQYTTQAVSVVKAADFSNVPAVTPQQLLQGQVAGVSMTNSSGLLGNASLLRVRGTASITAGTQPLFIVDGVPLNDGSYNTAYGGGASLNPLLEINPEDIESMTVLKDAAAAAIYGSRGSNGVVLIATKKGGYRQKTQIKLDYATGWVSPAGKIDVMNGEEYVGFFNNYITKVTGAAPITPPAQTTDWPSLVTRTGRNNNYALSASGGNEKTRFYIGGNYANDESFVIGNNLQKLSGRINLEHTANKHLRIGVNFTTAYTNMDRITVESGTLAPYTRGLQNTPVTPAYTADGQYATPTNNVLANINLSTNKYYTRRNTGNAYAKLNITDYLWLKTDWGMDLLETEERYRRSSKLGSTGTAGRAIWQDYKWLTTNSVNFEKRFAETHYVSLLAAHSYETARYDDIRVTGTGFISDLLPNVGSAATNTGNATGKAWGLESYIFRGNYRYKDKYLFEGTLRRDGSSRFDGNNRYGNFWAVSGGWIMSEEQFIRDLGFIDYMKVTASYGVTGNDRIGYYDYMGLYTAGVDANYGGNAGLRPTQIRNPKLSWEESRQMDLGLAVHVLDNRLQVAVNYYSKHSENLLLYVVVPSTTGFGFATRNAGEMRNRGVDLQITGVPVKTRDLQWTTTLNLGYLNNKVLSLPPDNRDDEGRNYILSSYNGQRVLQGHSLNTFYLLRYKGINPETGDPEWYTKDGKTTSTPAAKDQTIAGSAMPKWTGGFNNTVRYKQFDLGVNFYFSYGNKVMLTEFKELDNVYKNVATNVSRDLLNYWQKPGDQAFAPSATSASWKNGNSFAQQSTAQLFDGSFLRLKTLSLGYNVPAGLLNNTHILSGARLYVMGQNLWTVKSKHFRGADPEVSQYGTNAQVAGESYYSLPQPKSITVGANLIF
ncbi:SusC/RagA family TonB-linked outer membrane protein [Chitinophaga rhizophila]|uniref:SusC/RagA family TonB-linked outer membrane protein n=1 Tax=Chitinophaga rhizophila TaxID=2866212 RepID=A0ABS7GDS5_9BACT|nr:SusC/RagA family TonB-linked outer membrane protein [Chitinophaga rhizophila]MBW8685822.1 SusC/RagA family TonB-linked outer membrane protein [Chitinophaga rhizophila]